jgi:bifunctional non-homologous end joining protein LigD
VSLWRNAKALVSQEVVVEVEYRQFTGRLRHPALKTVVPEADSTTIALSIRV